MLLSCAIVEENFAHLEIDEHSNERKKAYFKRNTEANICESSDQALEKVMGLSSKDNIIINTLDTANLRLLQKARDVLKGFSSGLTVLSMQSVQPYKTIGMLKKPKSREAKQIVELIKAADLDIDDFLYNEDFPVEVFTGIDEQDEEAKGIHDKEHFMDVLKLISIRKGKALPSIIFDSLGTKKIVSLAGYLVDCLNNGGSLLIDELDSGLHFKLSRSVVSLFNSSLNTKGQLIFTTHDTSLLDTKTLFRKEQIWFTDRVEDSLFLYSLSDFTAQQHGVRLDSNLYELYSKGFFGASPAPSLVEILISEGKGDYDT